MLTAWHYVLLAAIPATDSHVAEYLNRWASCKTPSVGGVNACGGQQVGSPSRLQLLASAPDQWVASLCAYLLHVHHARDVKLYKSCAGSPHDLAACAGSPHEAAESWREPAHDLFSLPTGTKAIRPPLW